MGARCGKEGKISVPGVRRALEEDTEEESDSSSRDHEPSREPSREVRREKSGTSTGSSPFRPPSRRQEAQSSASTPRAKEQAEDLPAVRRRDRRLTSRTSMVQHKGSEIQREYDVGEKEGEGTQGTVFRATRKRTGVARAIKKVPKKNVDAGAFRKEIAIMKRLDHPNIIKLFETFDDRQNTYLVMELCSGGELFKKIVDQGHLSEREAAIVLQQILRAVHYMHENHLAHRDLKPENFIFCSQGPIDDDNLLKLIDFGCACECDSATVLKEVVGTPYYVAPQVMTKKYDKMCDLWSCGVIMYTLLSGNVPFNAPSDKEVLVKVREGIVRYSAKEWGHVSDCAKNLVKRLLTRNPKERITAMDALEHNWIKDHAPGAEADLEDNLVEKLGAFRRKNKLKQAALTIVASEMSEDQIKTLRETFVALDTNGDGLLTYGDIKDGVEKAGIEVSEDVMRLFRKDMNNEIDYTEFVAATLDKRRHLSDEAIRVAFGMFDVDAKGTLTTRDISQVFATTGCAEDVVKRYGKKGADGIDFDDFRAMMGHETSPVAVATPPTTEATGSRPSLEDRFELLNMDPAGGRARPAPCGIPSG